MKKQLLTALLNRWEVELVDGLREIEAFLPADIERHFDFLGRPMNPKCFDRILVVKREMMDLAESLEAKTAHPDATKR